MSGITNSTLSVGAAAIPVIDYESRAVGPVRSFWRSPRVQNLIPFLSSLALHATLVCVGLLTYKAVEMVYAPPAGADYAVPATLIISDNTFDVQSADFGVRRDPLTVDVQDKIFAKADFPGFDTSNGINRPSICGNSWMTDAVIGVGVRPAHAARTDRSEGSDVGSLANFGVPIGPGTSGGGSPMFYVCRTPAAHARKVVFVCDASGSMLNKMATLKAELGKTVMALKPIQSFNLIFFTGDKPLSLGDHLVQATPEGKARAVRFLEDVTTSGATEPTPGIEQAFREKPEMIYLLTDGDFPDNDAVLNRIRLLNRDRKVRIHTIAFAGQSDTDGKFKELLHTVATENGGTYKCISPDDL